MKRTRHETVAAFALGTFVALLVIGTGAWYLGGWAGLVRVGSRNPMFNRINHELGPLPSETTGHDGQLYYLIARDPAGSLGTPEALASFDPQGPRYRYQRILFPLLAGGFGQFGPKGTLVGMLVILVLSIAVAGAALAELGGYFNVAPLTIILALMNPGSLIGVWLLTGDPMALALALVAVVAALRGAHALTVIGCTLAALTKEVYLLVPLALAAWHWHSGRRSRAISLAVIPALPVIVWGAWLAGSLPSAGGDGVGGAIGAPFRGLAAAVPYWIRYERHPFELMLALFTCLVVARGIVKVWTRGHALLRWLSAPWIVLAVLATFEVWGKPNNVARAIAILWPMTLLARQGPMRTAPSAAGRHETHP